MALSDDLEALAKRHGATSYRNRADTQNPAYGFTEGGLNGLIGEVLAKWGQPAQAAEPVAWLDPWTGTKVTTDYDAYGKHGIPLYTAPQPVEREPLTCEWTHNDDDGYWDTSCGEAWRFDDGGPKENNMNFCPCCGKTLRIKGGQHGTE